MIVAFLPFDDKTIKEFAIKLAAFFFLKMKVQLRKGLDPLETVGPPIHPQFQTSHLLHRQPTVPYHLPVSQTIKFTSVQHLSDSQIHQPCSTNPSTNSFLHTINSRHSAKLVDNACILTDCLGLASTSRLLWQSVHLRWLSSFGFLQSSYLQSRHLMV